MKSIVGASVLGLCFVAFPHTASVEAGTSPACPYTAAELSPVVGVAVKEGTAGGESDGERLYCYYEGTGGVSVQLYQYKQNSSVDTKKLRKMFAGRTIPNDPDLATWLENAEGSAFISLGYLRHSTKIELHIDGLDIQNEAVTKPVKDKLLKLRRVP